METALGMFFQSFHVHKIHQDGSQMSTCQNLSLKIELLSDLKVNSLFFNL
jgi:hypothetical protein